MRMLFTFVGQQGHFEPLVPLARAAASAGHEVTLACRPSMTETVEAAGFDVVAVGPHIPPKTSTEELKPPDRALEEAVMRDGFADCQTRGRVPGLLDLARARRADVVVSDDTDFAAAIVSEVLGLRYAPILVIAAGTLTRREVVGPPLHRVRVDHDLRPDPGLAMLHGDVTLVPFPPAFRDSRNPLPPTTLAIRPAALQEPPGDPPGWLADLGERPVVWFTLGTVFNIASGDLLTRCLPAFEGLPVDVVVTTGRDRDPVDLGPLPAHIRAEAFVPQGWLLPKTDLVVSHGGSGSVIGALAHGAASIVMPLGADQPDNADRVEALGVGRRVDPMTITAAELTAAVEEVLADVSCPERCRGFADEVSSFATPAEAVRVLEALV